jgi:hypothetical protein
MATLALLTENDTSFGSRRTLLVGVATASTFALCALAYFFLASTGEKKLAPSAELSPAVHSLPPIAVQTAPAQTAELAPAIQSVPSIPVRAGFDSSEPSPSPDAVSRPEPSPSIPSSRPSEDIDALPKVASPSNSESGPDVQIKNRDIVFLQRPGVKIRSTPSTTGSVLGTARKGTRFAVTNREGEWVRVDNGRLKGWINAQFLASTQPR